MSKVATIDKYDPEGYKLKKAQKEDLKQLIEVCKENMEKVDEKAISTAFKLCYLSHEDMTRASGEPYYYHPVEVAKIVA
ncbi:MAG: RelA/SpoT family protein, partial [Gracilimonas sp.]